MPKGFLVINPRSGTGDETPSLAAAARERGIETHVLRPGEDPAAVVGPADVVGMAGGDGSMGAVAGVALERGVPFVCVPFGTRNHFARDLGLDDPFATLAAFADGAERRVDVGRAGDRVFVNNVSIGAYATLVHRNALQVLRSLHRPHHVTIDGEAVEAHVVLFANNAYRLDGARERLDAGELHLYIAHGLLHRSWNERVGTSFTIDGCREVAIDGEAEHVETPLEISLSPGGLTVLVPRERD